MVSVREICALLDSANTIDVEIGAYQYVLKSKHHAAPLPALMRAFGDYAVERVTTTDGPDSFYIVVKSEPVRLEAEA